MIQSVVIPVEVETIGRSAFNGCTNLSAITYPLNLSSTGRNVYSGCSKLTCITVPEGKTVTITAMSTDGTKKSKSR